MTVWDMHKSTRSPGVVEIEIEVEIKGKGSSDASRETIKRRLREIEGDASADEERAFLNGVYATQFPEG